MENATKLPMVNLIKQEFLFKSEMSGTSKKTGNSYHSIELHDPNSLENMSFFLEPGNSLNTTGILFRDKVIAEFAMEFKFGKLQPVLKNLKKA